MTYRFWLACRKSALVVLLAITVIGGLGLEANAQQPVPSFPNNLATHLLLPGEPLATSQRTADGRPGPAYWQQQVDYAIDATLAPDTKRLSGTVRITYVNNAPRALNHLWLQLEQNAFRPDSPGATAQEQSRHGGAFADGGYTLHTVSLRHAGRTTSPTYHVDGTRMRVGLPRPLAPGDTLTLSIEYGFTLPERGADRTGWMRTDGGHIFQVAQWYPRMYVYDDIRGWDPLPYLGQGEFYLHYGTFDVRLTLPRSYTVAATGALQNPETVLTDAQQTRLRRSRTSSTPVSIIRPEEVGTSSARPAGTEPLTWHFRATDVRDVAIGASDVFIWDAARASARTHDVQIASYYPPSAQGDRREGWEASTRFLQHSVEYYSSMWYPYPYERAQHVAGPVRGMEYPQLSFSSVDARGRGLFAVADHELAHTYFPMLVGSDERRYAWLDEGLVSFMNLYSRAAFYDDSIPSQLQATARAVAQRTASTNPTAPTVMAAADAIPRNDFGFLAYRKPAAALHVLREHVLGPERFDAAFRAYIERWAYKHPSPYDFFRTIEDVSGENLSYFWRAWFFSHAPLDQELVSVNTTAPHPSFTVRHNGSMILPMTVQLTFADGRTGTIRIPAGAFANNATHTVRLAQRRIPQTIEIDPDRILPDVDRSHHTWNAP